MILDMILGNNIDTKSLISDLKELESGNIVVLDYDYFGEPKIEQDVLYLSANDAIKYRKKFSSTNYYKTLYALPGMQGKMSSLYKKRN